MPFIKLQTCDAIFVDVPLTERRAYDADNTNAVVGPTCPLSKGGRDAEGTVVKGALLVTGYPEDGAGVAQRDQSTGRHRINFRGVHTMGTFCWTALIWLVMAAAVVAAAG
jgi:hypothetical protein